jgi:hypothetical protein
MQRLRWLAPGVRPGVMLPSGPGYQGLSVCRLCWFLDLPVLLYVISEWKVRALRVLVYGLPIWLWLRFELVMV